MAIINGTNGNDNLVGTSGDDDIYGLDGDDIINAGLGGDHVYGGDGNDYIHNGGTLAGEFGAVYGGNGDDTVITLGMGYTYGGAGNDYLRAEFYANPQLNFAFVNYEDDPGGIIVNFTATTQMGVAGGDPTNGYTVLDGYGDVDNVAGFSAIFGSHFNDYIFVDSTYQSVYGSGIEVRPGGGDDFVSFDNVGTARISYRNDGGGVYVDMEAGYATDLNSADNYIGYDTFVGANEFRGSFYDDEIYGQLGDDKRLRGENGDDYIDGRSGDDRIEGDGGNDTLIGGSGKDFLNGGSGNDIIISGTGKDNLWGGSGDDILDASIGTAATEGSGDFIRPGTGSNTIIGNADLFANDEGIDISYSDVSGSGGVVITVTDANGTGTVVSNNAGVVNDTFTFTHYFQGTNDGDTFYGSANSNWEGFSGAGGDDLIDGGDSYDELLYNEEEGGGAVYVDFASGTATDTYGDTDTILNIEAVRGTDQADTFIGSDTLWFNSYRGMAGDDTIIGSAGWDRLSYDRDVDEGGNNGIYADLVAGTVVDGFGDTDTVSSINHIRGTNFDDTMIADNSGLRFEGSGGDDTLIGGTGIDDLRGGSGEDTISTGLGNDIAQGDSGNDTFIDNGASLGGSGVTGPGLGKGHIKAKGKGHSKHDNDGTPGHDKHHDTQTVLFEDNDIYTGGTGDDTFIFLEANGHDIIKDFAAGAGSEDQIDIADWDIEDFAALLLLADDQGGTGDTVITLDEFSSITLEDVQIADLHIDDFLLA